MKEKKLVILAKLALFSATLIWGSSFIIVKDVTDTMPTSTLLAIRFVGASLLLSIIFHRSFKNLDKWHVIYGSFFGLLLFTAYSLQTIGITDTTPGKNAFLTAVYVVMVPFMAWGITKKKPDRYNIAAALICLVGIGMVSLTNDLTVRMGDVLTLGGGIFYALHIIAVSKFSENRDPVLLTIFQFAFAGVCATSCSLIFDRAGWASIVFNSDMILSLLYLIVGCTAVALLFQNFGQKYTSPSTASLLLSLESVFGVAFSVAFGREESSVRLYIGFVLIFIAVVISETKLAFLKRSKTENKI